nr:type IV pilus secretin family protein [Leptolyngbya sp. CCY15150]
MTAQPASAQPTRVTGVQVTEASNGVEVVLQTQEGDRPQVFTIAQGNTLVSDIINTQLQLPEGNGYLQNNPAPGIASVSVTQVDENSIRLSITSASDSAPSGQVRQADNSIVFDFANAGATAQAPAPAPAPPPQAAPAPPPSIAQMPSPSPVLVPNPELFIDGVPVLNPAQGFTPPLQSRAVAPPLGDIAVSTLDTSRDRIDLATTERVPRLVLRDAPVRDVLSLLARAANLNIAYIGEIPGINADDQASGDEGAEEVRISLDIENEPVQDVFNYVLRISGLEANREGRTIFVGPRLPDDARNIIARTLRLNQVTAAEAANFLATQGAESRQAFQAVRIETIGEGAAARTVEVLEPPQIVAVEVQPGESPLLLQGLSVTTDNRLNAITLVGSPRRVQTATDLLAQLDLRRRQVAINVKVVDVNLLATEDFSTSFSFGIGDGFFVSDGGSLGARYGEARPPSIGDFNDSRFNRPITGDLFPPTEEELGPFLDAQPNAPFGSNQSTGNPAPFPGEENRFPDGRFPRSPFGTNPNPLQPGITEITEAGIEFGLPQLYQYTRDFLFDLQAQVVSGNAKILTDPTLTVQEGSRATVQLTSQVYGGSRITTDEDGDITSSEPIINDAGLILDIIVDRIDDNGFVTMSVEPTVSSISQVFSTERDGDIVLLQERTVRTERIRMRDGQTLILAGIIQDSDRVEVSKVPILGDIPILGALFRSTNRENSRQEVVVLVTPQILDDSDLSNFGYRYSPGQDVQEVLRQQGMPLR